MSTDPTEPTIVSLFCSRAAADADRAAIHVRMAGRFTPRRWSEVADDVRRMATALIEVGIQPGDRVAMVSPNRYEWIVADLAIQMARAVHVPLHVSLSGPQMAWQIADSGSKIVLVAGPEQAAWLSGHTASLPADIRLISFDPCDSAGDLAIDRLAGLLGLATDGAARRVEKQALVEVRPGDLATILYTSGTTGEPKGVMLSQQNLASNALATLEAFEQRADDLRLAWLPLSHIFARTCDLYTWIAAGSELALAESPEAVVPNCGELQPTLLNGVPYFFERVQRYLTDQRLDGVEGALLKLLGGRMRAACSGGAALPDHVARFYLERGVLLTQGYGLTESSPVISAGTPSATKIGTVGRPIPGVEVRISAGGEILTRGPHVMLGYWKKPRDTAEAIRDGWLHTGDLGQIDEEGFLRITGRKKELIVTAAGKNIAPTYIEALLTADPLIRQAVVIGDGRNFLTSLIVPNFEAVKDRLADPRSDESSDSQLLADPRVVELFDRCIRARLADVSHYEQVRRFALVEQPFSVERGELTLTLKLRRQTIAANYARQIEALYAGGDPGTCQPGTPR